MPDQFAKPAAQLGAQIANTAQPTASKGLTLDETGFAPGSVIKVLLLTADPASPQDGQVWIRTDTNQFCARYGGATKRVTLA